MIDFIPGVIGKPRVRIRDPYFHVLDPKKQGSPEVLSGVPENHPNIGLNGIRITTSRVIRKNAQEAETNNTIYELVKYESQDVYETRLAALRAIPGPQIWLKCAERPRAAAPWAASKWLS